MVLAYPGGVREIMNSRFRHEHVEWCGRTGFARVAVNAGVPVIPVASVGVNGGFVFLTAGRRLGKLLFRGLLRLGPEYDDYRDPLAIGLLPLPLPFSLAVHLPLPCKVRYVVGEPVYPDGAAGSSGGGTTSGDGETHKTADEAVTELATRVAEAMGSLIAEHGRS